MDNRATRSRTGTEGAHPVNPAEPEARAERPAIGGGDPHDEADLQDLLRAIAARIDEVLDANVPAGGEPVDRRRATQAWSTVVGRRATDDLSDLRRQALATTVLRISADGRVDVDDRTGGAFDDAAHAASDRQADHQPSSAEPPEVTAIPEVVQIAPSHDVAVEPPEPDSTARSGAEERLRVVRERLAARRASATPASAGASGTRAPGLGVPVWRGTDARTLIQRLLIGLAIVGASAVVSVLVA